MLIFKGIFNWLIFILLYLFKKIILSLRLKVSLNEINLPLPLLEFINDIKGLLKIIENIVPWKESVITALLILIENIKFSI